jgi:hypothetical protein
MGGERWRRTNSSANILAARDTWSLGAVHGQSVVALSLDNCVSLPKQCHVRIMREIMEVPLPRAASRRLISFLTFQISMFFSASLGCCSLDDMVAVWWWERGAGA